MLWVFGSCFKESGVARKGKKVVTFWFEEFDFVERNYVRFKSGDKVVEFGSSGPC